MKTSSYLYEWLDNFVIHELNPSFLHPFPMLEEASKQLSWKLKEEMQRLKSELQAQYFTLTEQPQSALLIEKHHEAIIVLIGKAFEYQHHPRTEAAGLRPIISETIKALEDFVRYFDINFAKYLTGERHLPITQLMEIRELILSKKQSMSESLSKGGNGEHVTAIVMDVMDEFCARIERHEPIKVRESDYHLLIVRDTEDHGGQQSAITNCPSLHELLVYWNLNSKACIRYFTIGLDNIIKSNETVEGKLEFMRFQMKNITQLPQLPDVIYNPLYPGLKEYFKDYLANEISYLENKTIGFVSKKEYEAKQEEKKVAFKIKSTLSGDQLGMILRGAKEAGILEGSLNAVFKEIVPLLSSAEREELSWKSMRGNSYNAEERDKEIVVQTLEDLISNVGSFDALGSGKEDMVNSLQGILDAVRSQYASEQNSELAISRIRQVIEKVKSF
ncbi:hypothetical protein [Pedobacter paludis]|uniref:Uncharacterized protein n=1 Tax=Pedobacter paludis TaxID=2203212 RepID=A0A317EYZ7_9SPHI|nr:hypothetical protein [Pedobacter paludis]PWS32200.1 hypothetical protein DF947_10550 [Pedobacter paludis]